MHSMKRKKNSWIGRMIWILFCLCIIVPLFTIVIWAFTERWVWPDFFPKVFSMRAVKGVFSRSDELMKLFSSSVLISVVVAFFAVLIGTMTARALQCYHFFGKKILTMISLLPFLVPTTVFAMGIQITFLRIHLGGTLFGVMIVHLICSLPYAVRLLEDGTRALGVDLEEQARVLGAGPWTAFFKVTLPNLAPIMLSAFSMSYIVSFSQYFLTLIIGGGRVKTFAIVMVPYLQSGERNFASVYSLIFLGITITIFGLFEWLVSQWTHGQDVEYYTS